ncbi:hypothetical protein NLU13_5699 [Sarocladium strictum]|uniref:Complex I intermediate-associated protein 84 n=1 Tax=Sarocladium strictum TaxID=5046 RepID=A0AA39GJW9_SARSR|nr:hypothetical protein NLU13_5699 [Sarocladium strictum]
MRAHVARHARQALARRLATTAWPQFVRIAARPTPIHARPCLCRPAYRTFITSLLQKPPRDVRQSEYEPGWMDIMIWRSRMIDNLASPPPEKLRESWKKFFKYKLAAGRRLNSTQAIQCRRLLEYLCALDGNHELGKDDLIMAARTFGIPEPITSRPEEWHGRNHAEFAYALLDALQVNPSKEILGLGVDRGASDYEVGPILLTMLADVGELRSGLRMLPISKLQPDHLGTICRQVVKRDSEQDLTALIEAEKLARNAESTEKTREPRFSIRGAAIAFYAKHDRVKETMALIEEARPSGRLGHLSFPAETWSVLAPFAARNGLEHWAKGLFRELCAEEPPELFWHIAVAAQLWLGNGLRGAEALMHSNMMHAGNPVRIGTAFFNTMLLVAIELGDEQLANEVTALAANKNIPPNADTFLRWLALKVKAGNFDSARFSFDRLRFGLEERPEPGSGDRVKYENIINNFLILASTQKRPDFPFIAEALEYVDEELVRLEPETVAQLSLRFLENEQFLDVMDLLAVNVFKYGEVERQVVQKSFVSFCLDPNISTSRAWSAYQVLEQYFPDLERTERMKLMEEFFRRKRADMAIKVFGAMRNHRSPAYRPNESMYRQCFEGLARNPDLESTQQVHNWLKTDASMEPSTRLFTALMLAFTASGRSLTALDLWKEVTLCKEGPGYSTLAAVFWALEHRPNGAKMAREIWDRIERMDVEIPPDVYEAYVGAIAGSGHLLEAQKIIVNMASYVGSEPTPLTLAIAYNALPGRELQKDFEEWAQLKYRDKWAELKKYGRRLNELQLCKIKVQRPLKAY